MTEREHEPKSEVLFTEEKIKARVKELAVQIINDYPPQETITLICVLKGAFIFTADLMREMARINPNVKVDFIRVSSYGAGKKSSGEPIIHLDVHSPLRDQNIILVEDIVDTGYSIQMLLAILRARGPKSLKICALLSKDERREVQVPVDYLGFHIPDLFVVGAGLDYNEENRGLSGIEVKKMS